MRLDPILGHPVKYAKITSYEDTSLQVLMSVYEMLPFLRLPQVTIDLRIFFQICRLLPVCVQTLASQACIGVLQKFKNQEPTEGNL